MKISGEIETEEIDDNDIIPMGREQSDTFKSIL